MPRICVKNFYQKIPLPNLNPCCIYLKLRPARTEPTGPFTPLPCMVSDTVASRPLYRSGAPPSHDQSPSDTIVVLTGWHGGWGLMKASRFAILLPLLHPTSYISTERTFVPNNAHWSTDRIFYAVLKSIVYRQHISPRKQGMCCRP